MREKQRVKSLKEFNEGRMIWLIVGICLTIFMLILNIKTFYFTDDYTYFFSFADNTRITSISDIIKSMKAQK